MTEMIYTPKSEIEARIEKLQKQMEKGSVQGAIITHHTNLYYFTGTSQSGHLFVPVSGSPILMVRKSFDRARLESPMENIVPLKSLKLMPQILEEQGFTHLDNLGFELDVIPYNTWKFYKKLFNSSKIVDISSQAKAVRLIKSDFEAGLLKKACSVIDEVFAEVPTMLKEGMREIEFASLFEAGMRRRGFGGGCKMRSFNQDFFLGNIVSGSSGAVLTYFDGAVGGSGVTPANNPHGAGWKIIGRNEVIYIDYTCVVNGYTADTTRIFAIGELDEKFLHAHRVALDIENQLSSMLKPSLVCQDVYTMSLEMAAQAGLADHFMGLGKTGVKFIGHGVGLELDEFPVFAKGMEMELKPGMTFALEPKFVFPEGAIGIENTYLLKENGAECLNKAPMEIVFI